MDPRDLYDESRIDWRFLARGDDSARHRVHYCQPGLIELAVRQLDLSEERAWKRWVQLMYFFATIHVLARTGQLLPNNRPIQPPPQLQPLWRLFSTLMRPELVGYCQAFFDGQDLGWQERYPPEHRLNRINLRLMLETAQLLGFPVDEELWALEE